MNSKQIRGRLLLFAAAVLFSTGGAAIKAAPLSGWQVAGLRSLVSGLAMLALLQEARRDWLVRMIPVSFAYSMALVPFVLATKLTTAANAIFLQSGAPVYMLVLSPLLLRERVSRRDVSVTLFVAVGIGLLFLDSSGRGSTAPNPLLGNLLGACGSVAWALTLIGLRWLARGGGSGNSISTIAAGNLLVFLICLPMLFPLPAFNVANAGVILYMGLLQAGLSYYCLARGIRDVPAFEAATILLLEPVLNPVWTWLVTGEVPGGFTVAGGALIVSATFANAWLSLRRLQSA